jgi:parvulin-like peptidyl-prolyl isomerase
MIIAVQSSGSTTAGKDCSNHISSANVFVFGSTTYVHSDLWISDSTHALRRMTLHPQFYLWLIGFVLFCGSPIMAQNDLGPGRQFSSELRPADAVDQDRIARRVTGQRSRPRNAGAAPRDDWWSEEPAASPEFARPHQDRPDADRRGDLIRSSQIIALVGDQPILAGDLLGRINEALQGSNIPHEAWDQQRGVLLAQLLPSAIEAKVVYLDFLRSIPAEQVEAIRASIYEQFDEKQLHEIIKKAQVANVVELEEKMRAVGSSLDKTRRLFFEQAAAREMIRRQGQASTDITHNDLLKYYQDHRDDYKIEGRARWEQLTTRAPADASPPQKAKAYRKLAQMGNAVVGGAAFAVVARRDSEGVNADSGGQQDWTVQGSLVSDVLDRAIFALPIGYLSDILEDETGFHVIRVIERVDPGHVPFTDAQKRIREAIENERREAAIKKYIDELKAKTYIQSFLSPPPDNSSNLSNRS